MRINRFPLQPNSKIPVVKWQTFQTETTPDWSQTQYAKNQNWGMILGAFSGLCVVDTDSEEGTAAFAWLDEYNSPKVKTRKGFHFYFSVPAGVNVPRKIRCGSEKIGADLLGNGSYVVTPPSIVDDHTYEWIRPLSPDQVPPELPQRVLDMFLYFKPAAEGSRNQTLFNDVVATKSRGRDQSEALFQAKGFCNATGLPENVADDIVARIYGSESYPSNPLTELPAILDSTGSKCIQRSIPALAELDQADRDQTLETFQAKFRRVTDKDLASIEDKIEQYLDSLAQIDGMTIADMTELDLLTLLTKRLEEIFCIISGTPHIWQETHWQSCTKRQAETLFRDLYNNLISSMEERERRLFKKKFGKLSQVQSVLSLLPKEPSINFDSKENFNLFNTADGTFNFVAGVIQPHNKADLISDVAGCGLSYNEPKRFIQLLTDIFTDPEDPEPPKDIPDILLFFQQYFGYAMTAQHSSANDLMLAFIGDLGNNGKSTLLNILLGVFGTYYRQASSYTFDRKVKNSLGNDLLPFIGKRLMIINETDPCQFDSLKLKQILSAEPLTGRALYAEFQQFKLNVKPILATNHLPEFTNDPALWKRLVIINFDRYFERTKANFSLADEILKEEASDILGWFIQGFYSLSGKAIEIPVRFKDSTMLTRGRTDIVAAFCCDHLENEVNSAGESLNYLYERFQQYQKSNGSIEFMTIKSFSKLLRVYGYTTGIGTSNKTFIRNVRYTEFKSTRR